MKDPAFKLMQSKFSEHRTKMLIPVQDSLDVYDYICIGIYNQPQ